jgi:DNA polymerase-3 subunit beta
LSGIFFHQTQAENKTFLTAAATDSHRMSISKIRLDQEVNFEPIILPKKTIFQLCSLLESYDGDVKISNVKSKIKFELNNSILISKLIDGKFPNYIQVIPKNNQKKLDIDLKLFLDSVDRVASVSLDKKDGVKFNLSKDILNLSVNNTNSGDGKESLSVKFDHDLEISFNSRYLIDVASQLDGDKIEIFFNDTGSPALIKDPGDFDSIFVVMPMKG